MPEYRTRQEIFDIAWQTLLVDPPAHQPKGPGPLNPPEDGAAKLFGRLMGDELESFIMDNPLGADIDVQSEYMPWISDEIYVGQGKELYAAIDKAVSASRVEESQCDAEAVIRHQLEGKLRAVAATFDLKAPPIGDI